MPAKISYSHVYNRGVEAREMFVDDEDYQVFQAYLKEYLSPPPHPDEVKQEFTVNGRTYKGSPHQPKNYFDRIELVSYRLLPTHFHLILGEVEPRAQSRFLRSLCTRYSIYFNKKYKRRGSLFDGPYKSINVTDMTKLLYLSLYIHTHDPSDKTQYSSYPMYLGKSNDTWVRPEAILNQVINYKDFVKSTNLSQRYEEIDDVIIETQENRLERIVEPPIIPKSLQVPPKEDHARATKYAFFTVASGVYVLLMSMGLFNVRTHTVQAVQQIAQPEPSPVIGANVVPMVAGAEDEITKIVYSTTDLSPEIKEIINEDQEVELPKVRVAIISVDTPTYVNIRQTPSTESEILLKALNGDVFVLHDDIDGWAQIKLPDESLGYVSTDFIRIESEDDL